MTKLQFSKTRVCYWDSARSELKLPANSNTLPDGVTLEPASDVLPYRLAVVAGAKHNWHTVPINSYGYYCTPAEINALYENSSSITPISCSVTIGHNIPLSRNATTNATQLSFNNTIYSLIVDLPPNDHVTAGTEFDNVKDHNAFCRTFDGSLYSNLNRNVLPKPDIVFKVPKAKNVFSLTNVVSDKDSSDTAISGQTINFYEEKTVLPEGYSQNDLVNAYLPELLQDNNNVKVLYPGENQDSFHLDLSSWKDLATIPCDSIHFNESYANIDSRSFGVDMINCAFPNSMILYMSLVPVLRGPNDLFQIDGDGNTIDTPYTFQTNVQDKAVNHLNRILWSEIIQSKAGFTHKDMYTMGIPIKFIKCLPIMDQADTVVAHTVCGTLSWTLEVEVTERLYKSVNPLKWEMVYPQRVKQVTIDANKKVTTSFVREYYTSGWPKRPLNDKHQRTPLVRRRAYADLNDRSGTPYTSTYTPPIIKMGDAAAASQNLPNNQEQSAEYYTNAAYNDIFTATFKGTKVQDAVTGKGKSKGAPRHKEPKDVPDKSKK